MVQAFLRAPIVKELNNLGLTFIWTGADSEQFNVEQGKLRGLHFQTKFANHYRRQQKTWLLLPKGFLTFMINVCQRR